MKIAIDGPAGAGKSTISKEVAKKLGIIYIDTGAMYRAIGLAAVRSGIDTKDADGVKSVLDKVDITISHSDGTQQIFLNGENVSEEIRLPEISVAASNVAVIPEVRLKLVELQRSLAERCDVIMDGRDIGTTVFPNAELKIFMNADPMVRASRRAADMQAKGEKADIDEVLANLKERDYIDSHREVSPLTQAPDAVVLDNSSMTMDDQMEWVLDLIEKRFAKK